MDIVYLNGQYMAAADAKVSVFDRGFLFADSVYEVIPYYQGIGFQLERHITRLRASLKAIGITSDIDFEKITDNLVLQNGGANLSVYLQVTRGAGLKRSHLIDAQMQPTVFACTTAISNNYTMALDDVVAIKVIVCEDLRWQRCDIKSTSLLPNILAMDQARSKGAHEAILVRNGLIQEGASSNVFMVKNGCLIAPVVSRAILSGTTSELVQKIAKQQNIDFSHQDITYQQLLDAEEVWISSSTRGLLPVTQIDESLIAQGQIGPMWQQLYALLAEHQHALYSS
jgi:D-alanine transaminase